ncbi:hypothetical protein QJS66_13580 [Kocuria rhizophila]|nr:hypothetical protein QJS66_13580 [Kocuria rhizophila]
MLIQAVGGGGGKGMHVVERFEDLARRCPPRARVAKQSFGDDTRRSSSWRYPRHIEAQVLAGHPWRTRSTWGRSARCSAATRR